MDKEIYFLESEDGDRIKDEPDHISRARGILKTSRFSTSRYFILKEEEKALEKDIRFPS
jgi:hypothetical protein